MALKGDALAMPTLTTFCRRRRSSRSSPAAATGTAEQAVRTRAEPPESAARRETSGAPTMSLISEIIIPLAQITVGDGLEAPGIVGPLAGWNTFDQGIAAWSEKHRDRITFEP